MPIGNGSIGRKICFQLTNDFLARWGDAVITGERNYNMYPIFWNSSISAFSISVIGTFSNQPDDGIFLTSAILTPVLEPETYAMLLAGLDILGFVVRFRKIS